MFIILAVIVTLVEPGMFSDLVRRPASLIGDFTKAVISQIKA